MCAKKAERVASAFVLWGGGTMCVGTQVRRRRRQTEREGKVVGQAGKKHMAGKVGRRRVGTRTRAGRGEGE